MPYGKIIMDSGAEIPFEVEGPYRGEVSISDEGIIYGLQNKFGSLLGIIQETAASTYAGWQKMEENIRPDEFEITFGVKLSAQAGLVFARAGGEGTFQVTLKWKGP